MLKHALVIAIAGLLATAACSKKGGGGDATINSAADYESKAMGFMDKFIGVFTADGTDCGKLAKDITKLMDDNKALMDNAKAWEKAHPDDKKALDTKMEAKFKDFMDKAGPAMTACKDDKDLQAAMSKMPSN
jgi:hypothetical protein